MRGCAKGGAPLGMGASGPFVAFLGLLQPPQQLIRPEPFPGQHLSHHPVDLRSRDPEHLSPPSLLQTQEKRSAQQVQGHVMMPARPGAGLVLIQPHVAFFSLELGFNAPPRPSHVGQGLQGSVLRRVGQVVAGLAAVPVPAADGPVDFARLPLTGRPHPLGKLDYLSYLPQGAEESEVLFTLIAERYERRSLGITSNLVFSEWERIFANPMATAAAIDRVVHHSVILEFDGPSYRTNAAQQRVQAEEANRQN